MAENLIILVAIASVVGVFFLVLFSVLARRERKALRKMPRIAASLSGNRPLQLISWRVAAVVLILAVALAAISSLAWRTRR